MKNEAMYDDDIFEASETAANCAADEPKQECSNSDPCEDEDREKAISDALEEAASEKAAAIAEEPDEDEGEQELEIDFDEDTEPVEDSDVDVSTEDEPADERGEFYDDLIEQDWEMVLAEQEMENKKKAEKAKAKKTKERREQEKRQREQSEAAARQSAAYSETSYQPTTPEEYHEEHNDQPAQNVPQSVQPSVPSTNYHAAREEPRHEGHYRNVPTSPESYGRGGESKELSSSCYERQEPNIYEKAASEQGEQRRQEIDRAREEEHRKREEERRKEIDRKSQEIKEREQSHLGMVSKNSHLDLRESANNLEKVDFTHGNGDAENPTQTASAMPSVHYEESHEPRVAPQYTYGLGGTVEKMQGVESYQPMPHHNENQFSPREDIAVKEGMAYADYG